MSPPTCLLFIAIVVVGSVLLPQVPVCASATIDVYYAPEDHPIDRVVGLYTRATRYIYVSVYGLTAPSVVKALVEAKHRGVDVRVITDRERLNDPKQHSAVKTLRLAGVPVRINRHEALMHLKQVVIDDRINTSGSANHTTSGNRYNDERLDVITDPRLTVRAREKFLAMWNDHERFVVWME
ncbi:MAG: PLD phosphodiesterase domain-containing protein [Nitrospira sp.]|nr:MAG: PLD phosphodiesterase domain-containing protein [Nitrospira sp.]